MPSNPLDAYGLMLARQPGSEPGHVPAAQGAAAREGRGAHPRRARTTTSTLSKMIDAPLGDRTQWKPQWPELRGATFVPIGKAQDRCARARRSRWSATAAPCRCARRRPTSCASEGIERRRDRPAHALPVRLGARSRARIEKTGRVLFVNEDTEVTNFGEHLMRRTVEELFYELLAPPAAAGGQARPGHRPGRHPGDGLGAAAGRTSPRPSASWPSEQP